MTTWNANKLDMAADRLEKANEQKRIQNAAMEAGTDELRRLRERVRLLAGARLDEMAKGMDVEEHDRLLRLERMGANNESGFDKSGFVWADELRRLRAEARAWEEAYYERDRAYNGLVEKLASAEAALRLERMKSAAQHGDVEDWG